MITLIELDKFAKDGFSNQMRRRGFAVERKMYFWRKRGQFFDVFWSEILSSRGSWRVHVTILSPWVDSDEGEFNSFPVWIRNIGGTLSSRFPELLESGDLFDVATKPEIDASFNEVLKLVDTVAVPWFDSVDSYDRYVSYIRRDGYDPAWQYREQVKRGILLGFEKEATFFSDKYK